MQAAQQVHQVEQVEVWTAMPQAFRDADWQTMGGLLDRRESHRSRQFVHEADRRAYVVAHLLQRLALAGALGVSPQEIAFSIQASGKPALAAPAGRQIFFSLSRTRALVACALTRAAPIGIDVEVAGKTHCGKGAMQDVRLLEDFIAFTDEQRKVLSAASPLEEKALFCFYWTVLEAFWKAAGSGLSFTQSRIKVHQKAAVMEIFLEVQDPATPRARVLAVQSPTSAALSVVLADADTVATKVPPSIGYKTLNATAWLKGSPAPCSWRQSANAPI